MKRLVTLFLLIPFLTSLGQETFPPDYNCFTVLVGKNASEEGTLLYGHNDDDGFQLVNLYIEPRKSYAKGADQTLQYGGRLPQVPTTHKFFWIEVPGMEVSDGFMNEYGVCIGSNYCGSREDTQDISQGGILYDLRLIMAQRAKTAREAVCIAGSLIVQFGYRGSGRSYCISDREEAWVLCVVKGKRWAAARVPDDEVMILPNYYPIAEMDLQDTANYLGSSDLISYAQHRGWYDPNTDGKFNFRRAYASEGALKNRGNTGRAWSAYSALEEATQRNDNFPFSFKPKKKVSKSKLMELLAGHSQGMQGMDKTESCTTGNPYELNEGMICNGGTIYSFVVESRAWMPVEIGTVMWLAPRRCDVQPFIPWYCGVTHVPENYAKKGYLNTLQDHYAPPSDIHQMSKDLAYWNFEALSANINKDFVQKYPAALFKKQQMETSLLKAQDTFEKEALKQYTISPRRAIQMITEYSSQQANRSFLQTEALLTELNISFPTPEQNSINTENYSKYAYLALTPPMGWNSWNFFAKDINEVNIKATADAMVASGMRDAGYEYLVLDDAWMAADRDENGALQADPNKFPKGMKDIGDYIHSRGLKFGIYEDRAYRTCQSLPGSFEHEQIDMATFAAWGVDYIKLDSCSAEGNGRLSSEDYAIYRECIEATGRPMVLSISDFGNAAWVWGGKDTSQLWRTGWDIRSWMDSVYNCAECSAGSHRSHPAFNGLWQFAGPGHWNDPDMLQVGNFKIEDAAVRKSANQAHFGLWCILAAPLMTGNNLPKMTDTVRDILTSPEVIAVNQDPRGVQGYKVFVDGKLEIYNKPLADGTTAVLLLNKGRDTADLTVTWEMIGLSGKQPVRDLWERKDLGIFADAFTARALGQHGNRMLKIGKKGRPLPTPAPMPLEKYTITRQGVTSLSDLYYAYRDYSVPVYNKTFEGNPIVINGKTFEKGFGVKSRVAFMFAGTERGDRLMGTVALDESYEGANQGRFRIFHEDYFGNRVLWDSGQMTKDSPAKTFDIELDHYNCLMLTLDGRNSETGKRANDVLGVFGDPRIMVDD